MSIVIPPSKLQNAQCLKQYCNKNNSIKAEKYSINRKEKTSKISPFPNVIFSFGCTLVCHVLLMLRNTTDVF